MVGSWGVIAGFTSRENLKQSGQAMFKSMFCKGAPPRAIADLATLVLPR
jgi:hypothetical protein